MRIHTLATAGHVDHGKSTLVLALTGTDPDRLAEEKRRGLTIDLGFARLALPGGDQIDLIDVPGHVRFLKTMLAGVGGVDGCLLVIAATEGWKPQTEEHLAILRLLSVGCAAVVITMVDLVDSTRLAEVRRDVASRLAGSALEGTNVAEVDAVSARGIDDLREDLRRWAEATPLAPNVGRARLWIDRSFARPGAGTVVTGTLTGGALAVGDPIVAVSRGVPRSVRVRGLQAFGDDEDTLDPGRRAAVNLSGITHHDLNRGDVLVHPERWHLTSSLDATCVVLPTSPRAVRTDSSLVAYVGSGEHEVRVRLLGRARALQPGETGLARLALPALLPLVPGDRYVLRDPARRGTLGGGEVLDVAPVLRPSQAHPDRSVSRIVRERGWVEVDELERLTGARSTPTVGSWVVAADVLASTQATLRSRAAAAVPVGLELAPLSDLERAVAAADTQLAVQNGRIRPASGTDPLTAHPFLERLAASPHRPPLPDAAEIDPATLSELARRGLVVREEGIAFLPSALDTAADAVAGLLVQHPDGVTVSQVREKLRTNRRSAVALLALLDRSGHTRRRGDLRIAGPRINRRLEAHALAPEPGRGTGPR